MATIAVGPKSYMRPLKGALAGRMNSWKEEASQSFVYGDLLIQDSSAKDEVELAGADPVAGIIGLAQEAASGTADTLILVHEIDPHEEYVAHVQDTGTLAAANVGTSYGLVRDSSNKIWRVDLSETSNVNVVVTRLIDAIGDVNGRVAFRFLTSVLALHV